MIIEYFIYFKFILCFELQRCLANRRLKSKSACKVELPENNTCKLLNNYTYTKNVGELEYCELEYKINETSNDYLEPYYIKKQ